MYFSANKAQIQQKQVAWFAERTSCRIRFDNRCFPVLQQFAFPRNHFRNFPPKGVYLQWNNASSKPCFRTLSIIWKCFQQRNREEFSVTAMQKVFSANFAKMSTTENLHLPIYQTEQTPFCVCHINLQSWKSLPFDVGDTK